MQKGVLIFILCLSSFACKQNTEQSLKAQAAGLNNGEEIPSLNFNQLKPLLNEQDGKVHVVNFWATWCKPCVEELPIFEKLNQLKNIEVLLVSMDMPKMKESHLKPYLKRKNIKSKVVLLDDPNSNVWIPKVNETWDGAIPATLIYKNKQRQFKSKKFESESELKQLIKTVK